MSACLETSHARLDVRDRFLQRAATFFECDYSPGDFHAPLIIERSLEIIVLRYVRFLPRQRRAVTAPP